MHLADLQRRLDWGVWAVSLLLLLGAAAISVAWIAGAPELTRLGQESRPVPMTTALALAAASIALVGILRARRDFALGAAAILVILGFGRIIDWPPVLASPGLGAAGIGAAGIGFVLTAIAVVLLAAARARSWAPAVAAMLGLALLAQNLISMLGHTPALSALAEWAGLGRTPMLSALCLALLAVGLLLAALRASNAASLFALPWLATGVGFAGIAVSFVAWRALHARVALDETAAYDVIFAMALGVSALVAAWLAQARNLHLQSLRGEERARHLLGEVERRNERLQEALEQRQVFTALVESSSDFIAISTADGRLQYINPAGLRVTGLDGGVSIRQTHLLEYFPPQLRDFAANTILKSALEQGRWMGETLLRNWRLAESVPVSVEHFQINSDDRQRVLGIGTVMRDISELKRAQQEAIEMKERLGRSQVQVRQMYGACRRLSARLKRERSQLAAAQAAAHIGSWELNHADGTLSWSPETFRIFGLDPKSIAPTYRDWLARVHPDDRERVHQRRLKSSTARHEFELAYRIVLPDGSEAFVEERGRTLFSADNRAMYTVGTLHDVTRRRRAEETMHQATTAFSAANDAIIVADADCRITSVNAAFTRITGFKEEEVLGRTDEVWRSDRHDEHFYRTMHQTLHDNGTWTGEVWNRRSNNEVYPALQNTSVVRNEAGEVTHYVTVITDLTQVKAAEERLRQMAHEDTLTGLPNRAAFAARLDQALEHSRRHGGNVGLLMLDLDRFKGINDTLGHVAGDQLLQEAAQRLKACARAEDTVARLGGDEFAVIVGELSQPQDAQLVALKISEALREPVVLDNKEVTSTASIGIGLFPDDADTASDLVRAADAAMYRAKSRGRNTFSFYTAELNDAAASYMAVESGLRRALARDELVLHFQPQVEIASGRTVGVEALLRWDHPDNGLMSPDKFIQVAEETGLIEPIGEWVLNAALEQAMQWGSQGLPLRRISVNVSGRQILYNGLSDAVALALSRHPISRHGIQLELEITETTLLSFDHSAAALHSLREHGTQIAIDDFGTGYSSLSRLKYLPIDTLKVDKSFIHGLPDAADSRAIATAIIAMGHSLNLHVIAEGVETPAQLELLRELGCDEVQGYLVCAPGPAKKIEELLSAGSVLH